MPPRGRHPRLADPVRTSTLSTNAVFLRELKRRYRYLYNAPVIPNADGSFSFHQGRLFHRDGIHALQLKGDPFEMAFQHGRLLREQIHQGILVHLSRTIPNMLHNSVSRNRTLNRVILGLVDFMGRNLLRGHIPWESLKESFALAEGAGLPLHVLSNSLLAMEALYILARYAVRTGSIDLSPMAFAGCSAFAAWGSHTRDGEILIGRNIDYPLTGYFDAFPTVAYCEPTDHGQKFVMFTSAGMTTPSLTAVNESGVYLGAHIVPTEESSFQGTPIYFLASDVIRFARSFDEAVERFRQYRVTHGWAYVLASFKERRVATVEMTNERVAVRESYSGLHVQSNHFLAVPSANMYVNRSVEQDSLGRYLRMEERLRELGVIDEEHAAALLGDCYDPIERRIRGLGNTVAVHITVGSVVLVPSQGKFYVAKGRAPVSHNDYVEFPSLERFHPDTFQKESHGTLKVGILTSEQPELVEAIQGYIKAKMQYEYDSNADGAFETMEKVVAKDPGNPAYRFVLAVLALKKGMPSEAARIFDDILKMDHTAQLHDLSAYYRGRIRASHGEAKGAIEDFDKVLGSDNADEKLKRAARKARNITAIFGSYSFRADRLPLMMQFADMVSY